MDQTCPFHLRGKEACADDIIFRRRRADHARPGQLFARQMEVRHGRQPIKIFAPPHDLLRVLAEDEARVVAVRVLSDEGCAPFKRAHDAVGVPRGEIAFLDLYPAFEQLPF